MISEKSNIECWLRRLSWGFMSLCVLALCIRSSSYFLPGMPFSFRPELYPSSGFTWFLLAHIGGGVIAALAGPLQFWGRFRSEHKTWHRRLGLCYLMGIGIGAPAALIISPLAQGGLSTQIGFGLLAVLWAATTFTAYLKIIRKDWQAHQQWMIRSYALTFAFVTLRVWLVVLLLTGAPFEEAYQTTAWLCWVSNLIIAELYINWRAKKTSISAPSKLAETAA